MRRAKLLPCGAAVVAASAAVVSASLGAVVPAAAQPAVSHLRLSPSKFRTALTPTRGFGATVHFDLSENSVQTYVVKERQGAHWVTLKGSFVKRGRAGMDTFPFPGVVRGRKLLEGHYELIATPSVTGVGTGEPEVAHFTVIG